MGKKPLKTQRLNLKMQKPILSTIVKEKLIDVLKAAASHPVTAALVIMTATTIGQIALKPSENSGNKNAKDINYQLGGLYAGAQGIATAAVVVPVITTAISAGASAAESYFGMKAPTPAKTEAVKP